MNAPTLPLYALPSLGAYWPGQGGIFVGLLRNAGGATEALIRAEEQPHGPLKWRAAMDWSKSLRIDGLADFRLPHREDARILWATDRAAFGATWYWLSTEQGSSFAWCQSFDHGNQYDYLKANTCRARAVRSFILQSFDPSSAAR